MSCCGKNRQMWRQYDPEVQPPSRVNTVEIPCVMYYHGDLPMLISGALTGLTYLFTKTTEGLTIDQRDAEDILQRRYFSLVPIE